MLKVKFKNVYGKTIGAWDPAQGERPEDLCLRAERRLDEERDYIDRTIRSGDTPNWENTPVRMELTLDTRTKCDCTP